MKCSSITVVILSHHSMAKLESCLRSLAVAISRSTVFDLFIAVGYQDERLIEIEAVIAKLPPLLVKPVRVESRLTVPMARNAVLERSPKSEWVLFLDDDITVPEDYFHELLELIKRWPRADIFGGPNLTPPEQRGMARISGNILASRLNWVCRERYTANREGVRYTDRSFILCNLLVHRKIQPIFSSSLPLGEELGLLQTAIGQGRVCVYSPSIAVFHYRRETMAEILIQMSKYGQGRGLVLPAESRFRRIWFLSCLVVCCFAVFPFALPFYKSAAKSNERECTRLNLFRLLVSMPLAYGSGVARGLRIGRRSQGTFTQETCVPKLNRA